MIQKESGHRKVSPFFFVIKSFNLKTLSVRKFNFNMGAFLMPFQENNFFVTIIIEYFRTKISRRHFETTVRRHIEEIIG